MGRKPLDELLELLELEALEVNLFRGVSPDEAQQRVFGGQVAAQALVAAGRTVDPDRPVNSLHAYFLRPGDPDVPIIYEVDRIRDGKSFTTRRVVAIQHGNAIFNLSASFQVVEPGPDHAMEMPDVPGPEDLPTFRERIEPYLDRFGPETVDLMIRERPIDSRAVADPHWLEPTPRAPAQDVWIRANGDAARRPAAATPASSPTRPTSRCSTPRRCPHAIGYSGRYQMASLDHAMWFHRPFRADEWLLYHQISPSASGARGLALGHVFCRDGTLAITVMQEGLIRPLP